MNVEVLQFFHKNVKIIKNSTDAFQTIIVNKSVPQQSIIQLDPTLQGLNLTVSSGTAYQHF